MMPVTLDRCDVQRTAQDHPTRPVTPVLGRVPWTCCVLSVGSDGVGFAGQAACLIRVGLQVALPESTVM
jgi:hypothetical protein